MDDKERRNRERLKLPRMASHDKEMSATPIETQTRKNLILKNNRRCMINF